MTKLFSRWGGYKQAPAFRGAPRPLWPPRLTSSPTRDQILSRLTIGQW
jgi:hypothetical protein